MGHLYPLAADARSAISGAVHAARTRGDAERLAGDVVVEKLETEWLTLTLEEAEALLARADAVAGDGFVQRYEDEQGNPVLAITYWKVSDCAPSSAPPPPKPAEPDHTDDLYFKAGRTRKRKSRRRRPVDPRQLDLFTGPDQQGFEYRDPNNPAVIIPEEEGDGTTFGD